MYIETSLRWRHLTVGLKSNILTELSAYRDLNRIYLVPLILHPHGIAPTFLKFYSWSPGADFIPVISTKGKIRWRKENCKKKVKFYMHTKRFNIFFLNMGAILCGCNFTIFWRFIYNLQQKLKSNAAIRGFIL